MKILTSISALLLPLFVFTTNGQDSDNIRNIKWLAKKAFYSPDIEPSKNEFVLFFENAIYQHENNHLPFYFELIPLNNPDYDIDIENLQFEKLTKEEQSDVKSINLVGNEIVLNKRIVYIRKKPYIELVFVPLRINETDGLVEKLVHFRFRVFKDANKIIKKETKKTYAANSVLNTGKWVKIKINKSGVYKLTFNELRGLGIENPEKVRIFGNGGKMLPINNNEKNPDDLIENSILVLNNAVYFYGEGPVEWKYDIPAKFFRHQKHLYSDYSWYFLSSDLQSSTNNKVEVSEQSGNPPTHSITSFTDFAFHEKDNENLIKSGRLWVGETFDINTDQSFKINIPNLLPNQNIRLETSLLVRSPIYSTFSIDVNNQTFSSGFSSVNYDYTATYAIQKKELYTVSSGNSDEITIRLRYNKNTASANAWLDYICINASRNLTMPGNQLQFRSIEATGTGNTGQFTISQATNQLLIWDVTNRQKPKEVKADLNGTNLIFKTDLDSLKEFVAFSEAMAFSPILSGDGVGVVKNQNLHGTGPVDLVILCHEEFLEQAMALKQIHEEYSNLRTIVVENQQVYNEFSSGSPDISAIRNFMRMLYARANNQDEMPKYLCLFGDGSFDNLKSSADNSNFILTYQSENSLSPTQSFVTDDFFGLLDENEGGHNGMLDIGIGRIAVKTKDEATNAINKIKAYLSIASQGEWRNSICFIADDEDYNMHMSQADELSMLVKNNYPDFNIEKIYLDAFVQQRTSAGQRYPDVNQSINNLISKGLLVTNYTGHGNERQLADEIILSIDQINRFSNLNKLTVLMTATCEFSRFDNYTKTTAGEYAYLNPKGAAIALFTTTRLVYATPNFELNKNFYNYIFETNPITNSAYTLGEVMMHTKNASGAGINKRNFTLLGDPALKLAYPQFKVKTNTINGIQANEFTDTIKALQQITIEGEVQNLNGSKITGYNGLVYPAVFDKKQDVKTLNNDGNGIFSYSVVNNQIFKGKASVKDGNFRFSFIVPKDIKYHIDSGRISYYGSNFRVKEDCKGNFTNFLIGGVSQNLTTDTKGPEIKLFMNNENFVSGGMTNQNPNLLVYLSDSSGINTTGSGIGHDIVATLNKNSGSKFILNDFYESDKDDYTKGKIVYNLPELRPGEHFLHLKAWDAHNNSTEDSLMFIVATDDKFQISQVLNYPNPFSNHTRFFFEHNRPNQLLDVVIQIFTVSGKLVKTLKEQFLTAGFRNPGMVWDGKDDFGNKVARGVYFYNVIVKTDTGEKAHKTEKLLIIN
jgi:hypothetical protein